MTQITKELKVVKEAINGDRKMFYMYQSSIAMNFIEEAKKFKKTCSKKYLGAAELHQIANNAAINFLNNWIKDDK